MPRMFLVLSLGMDSNSIFSGFAKKCQQLAELPLVRLVSPLEFSVA